MPDNDRKPDSGKELPEDTHDVKTSGGDPLDHADEKAENADDEANEGEGNKSADRNYREGVGRTVKSGQVETKAKDAEKAVDGKEGDELRRAEEIGKTHSHGEDPALRKK
ncbi:MAG: hypothetical protein ACREFC_09615 [Stellaceae bacterium]